MLRFKLKSLLVVFVLIAIVFAIYPRIQYYREWRQTRVRLSDWAASLKREQGKAESFCFAKVNLDFENAGQSNATHFSVYTAEPTMNVAPDGSVGWIVNSEDEPDPKRFYVIPPGKWVDDVDAVVENWYLFRRDALRN